MTRGGSRQPAALPPQGLPGLDPAWSRVLDVPGEDGGLEGWHLLDTGAELARRGVRPVGTILCVHGNPTWSYLWRALAAATLAAADEGRDAWRVVAPDQLEMGFSARTGRTRGIARRVRDLGRLTDALDDLDPLGPVVTFGHDWGGVVALGWAIDHPDSLAGVLSLNTAVHQPEGVPIPAPLRLALRPAILDGSTASTPAFLEVTLSLASPALAPDVRNAYRAPYRDTGRRLGIRDFVADIPVTAAAPSAAEVDRIADGVTRLDVPSLLLWGPRDPIFSDRYLDDLADRLPQGRVHRFAEAGHLIAEEVDYAGVALDWLGLELPGGSPAPLAAVPVERAGASRPLWAALEERRDDDGLALVELAPPGGRGPRHVSWRLLSRRVRQLASGLARAGVRPGDRVSLLVPPGADLTAALYACLRIGAVVVVADAGLGLRGLTRAVRSAWPDHVIGALPGLAAARALGWPGNRIATTALPRATRAALGISTTFPDLIEVGRDEVLPPEPTAEEVAAVLFTSGSTGPAKGVVYTHGRLAALRDTLAAHLAIRADTGLVAGFAPFALLGPALGTRSATPEMDVTSPKTLRATAVARAVRELDASVVFLSPAAVANVVATAGDLTDSDRAALAGVRTVLSAGAPIERGLLDGIARVLPNAEPATPYGMTEGLLLTDVTRRELADPATAQGAGPGGVCVGRPVDGVEIRIAALDGDGRASGVPDDAPGVTGEIVVHAAHVKRGYDRLWLADRGADHHDADGRRWHRTGDVGHLDESGRLWVEGRLVHVLVTEDGVVTPVGPEQRLAELPGVIRAGLAGVGPRGTQRPVAVLETEPGVRRPRLADPDTTRAAREAAGIPLAAVLLVPRLPTDIRHNSKVDRTRLSRWAEGVLAGGRMTAP